MKRQNVDLRQVEVRLSHPWNEDYVPLGLWIEEGPGARPLMGPIAARHSETYESLPLSVVPLRYRNTRWSRLLIRLGVLEEPWSVGPDAS